MKMIAEHGKDYFYNGPIAEAIAETVQRAGGCLAKSDLANHHSSFEDPISVQYRDIRVWECAPNGQGLAALLGLNILEGFDIQGMNPLSVERLHLEIEAMRIAFADAHWYIADPDFSSVPVEELLSKEYARERRKLINFERANPKIEHGNPLAASETVYLCVVDSAGNGCSFINSNYMGFGTGIVPPGYGFTLQNRGHNFSLDPNHPNCIAPGKRPYHTIIPALATRVDPAAEQGKSPNGEDLFACFGVMGGFMQPQGHLQVVTALVDDNLDPQSALDRPRFCIEDDPGGWRVAVEDGIPIDIIQRLADKGHPVERVTGHGRALFGRGQIIIHDTSNGALHGGTDPRADGCVMSI
jgi:gamma-glutamyltranspeptidase/glutathione hydrolase